MARINVTVDGAKSSDDVEPRTLLVQYLRENLGKVGPGEQDVAIQGRQVDAGLGPKAFSQFADRLTFAIML